MGQRETITMPLTKGVGRIRIILYCNFLAINLFRIYEHCLRIIELSGFVFYFWLYFGLAEGLLGSLLFFLSTLFFYIEIFLYIF